MATKSGVGVAIGVGALFAVGVAVAFAAGRKKKKRKPLATSDGLPPGEVEDLEGNDDSDEEDTPPPAVGPPVPEEMIEEPSPVSPGQPTLSAQPIPSSVLPEEPTLVKLPDQLGGAEVPLPGITLPTAPGKPILVKLPDQLGGGVVDIPTVIPTPPTPPAAKSPDVFTLPPIGPAVPIPAGNGKLPQVPIPLPSVEQRIMVPADTAQVSAQMLADEAGTRWKRKYPELGAWQAKRGLSVDQRFGPGTALRMADEIGTVPIVRYWPKGTTLETAVEPYQNALLAKAAAAQSPHSDQLLMSAQREQGQAFLAPDSPIATRVALQVAS